jgi:predicted TIM-barrel fold metal-dependent hydrolase
MTEVARLNRRQIVTGAAASAAIAAAALPGAAVAQAKARRVIDVHCHVFNGKDIPANRFLEIVVLQHYPDLSVGRRAREPVNLILQGVIRFIVARVTGAAPSVEAEADCLRRGEDTCSMPVSRSGRARTPSAIDEDVLADYARLLEGKPRVTYFKEDKWLEDREALDAFIAELRAAQGPARVQEGKDLSDRAAQQELARRLNTRDYAFRNVKEWGDLLSGFRRDIVGKYLATFDTGAHDIVLFAPALVDFSNWLGDTAASPLQQQVDLMDVLARRQKKARMHGYVAFDPLRQLLAEETRAMQTPLTLAKAAVEAQGFLGVKIYSPMGFRPTSNAGAGTTFPATVMGGRRDFGARLDKALDDLYAWCRQDGVVILAHASNSQAANREFGLRADPKFWRIVLRKHRELRLNLAHFGRFEITGPSAAIDLNRLAATWEWEIGRIIKQDRAPNVYADLSYFTWIIGNDTDARQRKLAAEALKRWFAEFDPECRRILFGTDWAMIAPVRDSEGYLPRTIAFLQDVGLTEGQLDNVLFSNAVRFFGLRQGDPARSRLASYYAKHKLDAAHLERFDGAS